ncbi:MAG TPA: family 20 glycosylhydrolase [Lysobacter sp.]
MKRHELLALAATALLLMVAAPRALAAQAEAQTTPVIPLPAKVEVAKGSFVLDADTRLVASGGEAMRIAKDLAARIEHSRGFAPAVVKSHKGKAITLTLDPKARMTSDEGYALEITPKGVRIAARKPAGLFYGAVTFWQLTSADGKQGAARIAAQRIEDAPRFAWRGLMLDVARHFRSVEEVKALIDQMALHKLNTLHWHLTDDQGWRIQIRRYPRLTDIGGCRIPAGAAGRNDDGSPRPYCGYYTQEQIREVVAYAAQRYVTVVPEIDLPGHAQAAIAAYPQLGVTGRTPAVSPDWGVHTWLFNVDDGTFAFLENVLGEVIELFPSRYVHLGGDEAVKDQWQQSAAVQAKRETLKLQNDMQLQSWFMGRLGRYLQAHGRHLVGWDEILEGGPPADATVMSWRGTQGAIDATRAGYDVVMSPAPDLYFDHIQSDLPDEIPGRLGVRDLKSVYAFEAAPKELSVEQQRHVLGAQANLWSEHQRSNERVQRAAFPRAAALAEAVWTPAARRDWNGFLQRLAPMLDRYRDGGFTAADSAFAVRIDAVPSANGRAMVTLSNQADFGTLRYTADGSEPTAQSNAYTAPLELAMAGQTIAAAAFDGERGLSAPRKLRLDPESLSARSSAQLRSCKGGLTLRMEDDAPRDGTRAVMTADVFDPCWLYEQAELDGAKRLSVRVGQLPFNFQLWRDIKQVVTRPAAVPGGALEVRIDRCDGPVLATLPLAPARNSEALTALEAPLPATVGRHDLCFVFASGSYDPLWAIDEVRLRP